MEISKHLAMLNQPRRMSSRTSLKSTSIEPADTDSSFPEYQSSRRARKDKFAVKINQDVGEIDGKPLRRRRSGSRPKLKKRKSKTGSFKSRKSICVDDSPESHVNAVLAVNKPQNVIKKAWGPDNCEQVSRTSVQALLYGFSTRSEIDEQFQEIMQRSKRVDPALREKTSETYKKVLNDMMEKGLCLLPSESRRKNQVSFGDDDHTDSDVFIDESMDSITNVQIANTVNLYEGSKTGTNMGKRGWAIIRRKLQELKLERRSNGTFKGWNMLKTHIKVMSDMERARQDLYERYGFTNNVKSGRIPEFNPMSLTTSLNMKRYRSQSPTLVPPRSASAIGLRRCDSRQNIKISRPRTVSGYRNRLDTT